MTQEFRPFVESIREECFERPCNPLVIAASRLLGQALVGYLLGQRMLEGVLKVGEQPRLVHKLTLLEAGEPSKQCLVVQFHHRLQQPE